MVVQTGDTIYILGQLGGLRSGWDQVANRELGGGVQNISCTAGSQSGIVRELTHLVLCFASASVSSVFVVFLLRAGTC